MVEFHFLALRYACLDIGCDTNRYVEMLHWHTEPRLVLGLESWSQLCLWVSLVLGPVGSGAVFQFTLYKLNE